MSFQSKDMQVLNFCKLLEILLEDGILASLGEIDVDFLDDLDSWDTPFSSLPAVNRKIKCNLKASIIWCC